MTRSTRPVTTAKPGRGEPCYLYNNIIIGKFMKDKGKIKSKVFNVEIDALDLLLKPTVAVLKIKSGFLDQADHIASHLRKQDYQEIYRSTGRCPKSITNKSWKISDLKWITFFKREPVALSGVVDGENNTGIPWMVATDKFHNNEVESFFLNNCRKYVTDIFLFKDYNLLKNCIDAKNTKALKWLEWCGFTLEEEMPFGVFNLPFIKFFMSRNVH